MTISKASQTRPTPVYEIRIGGHLDESWTDWFGGLAVRPLDGGLTILTGPLADQAALFGVLKKLHDLGLTLLLVRRLEPAESAGH